MDYVCVWEMRGQVYLSLSPSAASASQELRRLEGEWGERATRAFQMPATPGLQRMVSGRRRAGTGLVPMYEPFERVKASLLKRAAE